MATTVKVDDLSPVERSMIVDALALKLASVRRASKASTNNAVVMALDAESVEIEALMRKFR